LRAQLRERDQEVREIDALFAREIAPRERQLTDAALALGEALVERYRITSLDPGDAALLGQWIGETLERLQDHPFVAEERLQRLRDRWRRTVMPGGPGRCPALEGTDTDPARSAATCRTGSGDRKRSTDPHHSPHASPHDRSEGSRNAESGRDERVDVDAMLLGSSDVTGAEDGFRTLVERLFRRLAQALHPDREPDESRRALKQQLMGRALAARTARDLDTLLALHVQHIGEALPGIDPDVLERSLERQLEGMRRALTRLRSGRDPVHHGITERYAGPDTPTRLLRIERHAALIDRECARIAAALQAFGRPGGLAAALQERRERELDRLAIDELTGMSGQ